MKTRNSLKNMFFILLSIFLVTLISGCVTAKQKALDSGMKPITNAEFKTLFAEKQTAQFNNTQNGNTSIVTYLPDGTQSAENGGKTYPGTYYFNEDEYCSKMDFRNGEVKCTTWIKVDDKTYHLFKSNGSMAGKVIFK